MYEKINFQKTTRYSWIRVRYFRRSDKMSIFMRQLGFAILFYYFALPFVSDASIRFEHLSNRDGLSQQSVSCIMQDSQGFMWFGTSDGLNRYDGYEFKIFRHHAEKRGSISGNNITAIFEDAEKRIWVGTNNSGLNLFNRDSEKFIRIDADSSLIKLSSSNKINTIFQDHSGRLLVGTHVDLEYFNPENQSLSLYEEKLESDIEWLLRSKVITIAEDLKGNLWIGTYTDGVYFLDRSDGKMMNYRHHENRGGLSSNKVKTIFIGKLGDVWVGTEQGLNKYSFTNKDFYTLKSTNKQNIDLGKRQINALNEDSQGNLWIGTRNGLVKYNESSERLEIYTLSAENPSSLSNNDVRALYTDREGTLWIGTFAGGVDKIIAQQTQFNHVKKQDSGLSNNVITSFQLDKNNNLWIGSDGGGISKYDPQTSKFSNIVHQKSNPKSLSHNRILSIYKDQSDNMWVGTWGGGLNKYNAKSKTFKHYVNDKQNRDSLSNDGVISILKGGDGNLWLGTWGGGLDRLDVKTGIFKHFRHSDENLDSLSNDLVWSLLKDNSGRIWVGTFGGGVDRLDVDKQTFTHFRHNQNDKTSLSNDVVVSIFQDSHNTIWVGTQNGLNKYQPETNSFKYYRKEDGLPNNTIYGILGDSQGHLWLSTNKGLSRFDPIKETFRNFNEKDGLQSNEFNANAYFKSPKGELFFGGVNGFNRFNPKEIKDDLVRPKTVLTDFLLLNKSVKISMVGGAHNEKAKMLTLNKAINELKHLTLGYKENLFTFEFAGLNYSDPLNNQYAYKLENWDKDWIYTDSKNRRATFTNIPAGEYTLRVKASNSDGYWDEQGKSLPITILPAPWLTWWAYTLYGLILSAALGLFIHHERNKRKETQQINERLTEVDRLKDQFLANTSHELRTPLNGIIGLSELFLSEPDQLGGEESLQYVKSINQCGQHLKFLVDDLLDFSQMQNSEYKLNQSQFDIIELAKQAIDLLKPTASDRKFVVSKSVLHSKLIVFADKNRIRQVLYNLINNAIKFSSKDSIQVKIEEKGNLANISVVDKGIGIAEEHQDEIFNSFIQVDGSSVRNVGGFGLGLAICKNIIEQHGSKLWLKSEIDKGSQFSFSLQLDKSNG